ncbi:MAG: PhoH family protein [Candidatus Nezhaarchaeota archaeon]|nr:PhoH family protein [Candidatus Nezhaarchaeota archaeon]MCX8142544.1 PhoH family protein [Candidatus Nezhaarchaeota archaeon]
MSRGQEELIKALKDDSYEVVGVFGPTGTGKSLLSVAYGIDSVVEGKYKRFVIVKPVVDVVSGKDVTSIEAGTLYYDIASAYLKDILTGLVEWQDVEKLIREGKLLFADSHYLRGRTFDESVIFVDDAQVVMPESIIEAFMRVGRGSKLLIAGDPVLQSVLGVEASGVVMLREVLLGEEAAKVVDLGLKDIVRPGAKKGIRLLLEMKMRKRPLNNVERSVIDLARIYAPDADVVTVLDLIDDKRSFEITAENVPDALVIVKEGYLARLIGKGGERITKIEKEADLKLRAIELTLNFNELVRAIHPVAWIHKHIVDADFAGPNLMVKVKEEFGAFVGQRGVYIKFLDSALKRLIGVGIAASEEKVEEERTEKVKRSKKK